MRTTMILLLALALLPMEAMAQRVAVPVGKVVIGERQQQMLEAAKLVLAKDYAGADMLYSRILAADQGFIDAYIQRSVVRRELNNQAGSRSDAQIAVQLADAGIRSRPNDAKLYYQRGMGFRMLKDFPRARADIEQAIRLKGNQSSWRADLAAMALEQKAGR